MTKTTQNYVTVGNIQVELDGNGKATQVFVNPTSDFTVKFGKDSYIVLLPLDSKEKKVPKDAETEFVEARFKKLESCSFTVLGHPESVLTQLAVNRTVVEIKCNFARNGAVKVVSLKIPATL